PMAPELRRELDRASGSKVLREAAIPPRPEEVIEEYPRAVEALVEERDAVDREQERLEPDEVGGQAQESRALFQRLRDEPEMKLLEVPQPAVDEPRGSARRARADVVLLDESGLQAARRRIEERPRADDPAADDEHVEPLVR